MHVCLHTIYTCHQPSLLNPFWVMTKVLNYYCTEIMQPYSTIISFCIFVVLFSENCCNSLVFYHIPDTSDFYGQVAELSEPTCSELKEAIHSVVHGLLATLSPKMHSKAPPSENISTGIGNIGTDEDCIDLVESASLQYQPLISLTRDYLARLLFWLVALHFLCFLSQ